MGHTIAPMRWRIYHKLEHFKKMVRALREPERTIAESLLIHVHQHISSITYANPLPHELEQNIIFAMLLEEKKKCHANIENLTLLFFALMIQNELHNERDIKT